MKEAEETTQSGIILTANSQEKPQIAEVVEVGPGKKVDGKLEEMSVKKGDNVIVSKYAGTEVKYEGVDYKIVNQDDILAVVEK
jgi:chaperonin GroES